MSLTSYRAAPPRGGAWCGEVLGGVGWKTWRRPTLPRLETQYHGRWGFSRPSSGWDRVRTPRDGHQVVRPTPLCWGVCRGGWFWLGGLVCVDDCCAGWFDRADRAIRTG